MLRIYITASCDPRGKQRHQTATQLLQQNPDIRLIEIRPFAKRVRIAAVASSDVLLLVYTDDVCQDSSLIETGAALAFEKRVVVWFDREWKHSRPVMLAHPAIEATHDLQQAVDLLLGRVRPMLPTDSHGRPPAKRRGAENSRVVCAALHADGPNVPEPPQAVKRKKAAKEKRP